MAVPLQRAYSALGWLMVALGGVFLIILLIVDTLLRALVVQASCRHLGDGERC